MRVSLATLRSKIPSWSWRAERYGMGWRYIGEKAFAVVSVEQFSVLCGPAEDDTCTQWRVSEGDHSETFAAFWLREHGKAEGA